MAKSQSLPDGDSNSGRRFTYSAGAHGLHTPAEPERLSFSHDFRTASSVSLLESGIRQATALGRAAHLALFLPAIRPPGRRGFTLPGCQALLRCSFVPETASGPSSAPAV